MSAQLPLVAKMEGESFHTTASDKQQLQLSCLSGGSLEYKSWGGGRKKKQNQSSITGMNEELIPAVSHELFSSSNNCFLCHSF